MYVYAYAYIYIHTFTATFTAYSTSFPGGFQRKNDVYHGCFPCASLEFVGNDTVIPGQDKTRLCIGG